MVNTDNYFDIIGSYFYTLYNIKEGLGAGCFDLMLTSAEQINHATAAVRMEGV